MPRLHFTCAYNGEPFQGWQSQPGGNTVQDIIEAAFENVLHTSLRISSAGRTDAGVHARNQHFHVDVPEGCSLTPQNWLAAINANVPAAIRILDVQPVGPEFHARFSATAKTYEYIINRAPVCSPFLAGRVWHRPQPMDEALMAQAVQCYVGEHDFRRFAANRGNEPQDPPADFYLRTIYSAICERRGDLLRIRLRGNGFMYRMVRLLIGTAHQVAVGRASLQELQSMLSEPLGEKTRYGAPAAGLYLDSVEYAGAGAQEDRTDDAGSSSHEGRQ